LALNLYKQYLTVWENMIAQGLSKLTSAAGNFAGDVDFECVDHQRAIQLHLSLQVII